MSGATTTTTNPGRTLSPDQIAELHGVSPETVRDWLTVGLTIAADDGTRRRVYLPARKVGGRWKVRESDLDAFIEQVTAASLPPDARGREPEAAETEAQRKRRGRDAKARAAAALRP